MSKIDRVEDCVMIKLKHVLSVGLARSNTRSGSAFFCRQRAIAAVMGCHTSTAGRAFTGMVCACVCHKRHCAVDRSVRYIMKAEVISWGRAASCKWCHLHDTSANNYHHDTFGSHRGSGTHHRSHIRARYTWTWRSKGRKNTLLLTH
jgi:hypothetical protein